MQSQTPQEYISRPFTEKNENKIDEFKEALVISQPQKPKTQSQNNAHDDAPVYRVVKQR